MLTPFVLMCFFFFQAEDGIRDWSVTGVQTCALPISARLGHALLAKQAYRRLLVGKKRMPETRRQRFWAEIERVCETPGELCEDLGRIEYETKTRGPRVQPPARPAGEGVYAVARHGDHAHLAYRLELPPPPGEGQRALRILPEASYILAPVNPERPAELGPPPPP